MHQLQNKDIGMGYGTLVSLVFHNLPSLYPCSFCRNDFLYLYNMLLVCVNLCTSLANKVGLPSPTMRMMNNIYFLGNAIP